MVAVLLPRLGSATATVPSVSLRTQTSSVASPSASPLQPGCASPGGAAKSWLIAMASLLSSSCSHATVGRQSRGNSQPKPTNVAALTSFMIGVISRMSVPIIMGEETTA